MATFWILLMFFPTGSDTTPISVMAYETPFPYEMGCRSMGERFEANVKSGSDLAHWECQAVQMPNRHQRDS